MTAITNQKPGSAPPAEGRTPTPRRRLILGLRERARTLFPESAGRPIRRIHVVWAILAVIAGTAISLARTTGAGPFQTIGMEDAYPLLTDALNQNALRNLVTPFVGYFQLAARLLAELPVLFPVSWAAAVLSTSAAIVCALLAVAVYVAAGTHFESRAARLLVSAPMLFSSATENWVAEIYNRPATVHFFLAYALFWLLLWRPFGRAGRIWQVVLVGLTALSTFLAIIFLPLALLRLWALRDRIGFAMAGLLAFGGTVQWAGLHFGLTDRGWSTPKYEVLWAAKQLVRWAVPNSTLGWSYSWDMDLHPFPMQILRIGLGWLPILAVVVIAWRKLTRPNWLLALVAGAHAGVFISVAIMANGMVTQRYLMNFQMLLFSGLVALLIPATGRLSPRLAHAPLAVFAVLVLVTSAVDYRHETTFRNLGPLWTEQIAAAKVACADPQVKATIVRSGAPPYNSLVRVPCHLLTGSGSPCPEPNCVPIDSDQPVVVFRER